MKSYRTKK